MLATQPSWPLAFHVGPVGTVDDEPEGQYLDAPMGDPIVWIAAGDSPTDTPYAPNAAWRNEWV